MLCGKNSLCSDEGSIPVRLNVYDLTQFNGYGYWLGLGAFHSGVEVHGVEYAFGAHVDSSTGIFEGKPMHCEGFRYRMTIEVGMTDKDLTGIRALMEELGITYKGNAYNLISKNCNHFCNDVCVKLTGNPIPKWVNRLAKLGFLCKCVIPATLDTIKVSHLELEDVTEDNPSEVGKEKRRDESIDIQSEVSWSCSPSPSTAAHRRGRSISRRPRPRPRSHSPLQNKTSLW